ncbi:class I SAM-dependent methyltransferase [Pyxidicoccus fallax]|uniref:Class I SAM-dependent methyltransferase n=1 Tax=Pyxidicoccus fallax TaxID=394095 RepID=A0A848LUI4_9BACT|nr:class I SAM-dependent methyltransferase [Pyxidicoccus fallax]NMO21635.1 class I SAM-dependent methyltransferase [Pyxidicoccus fallax]NPC83019.1 class I SAM-dependent methyltransferase [Pyxidicoccus fallax]
MQVDFGRTSSDYAKHRAGFPEAFFERLVREGLLRPGVRAVDLGTGTGTVARGLARHGGTVKALDVSAPMLEAARRLATEAGLRIDFQQAPAETTGLPSGAFDLVVAGQCWHWFDRPAAAREAARLLAPGGRLVIAHFDWLPLPGNVVEATEALIDTFNPGTAAPYVLLGQSVGLYPLWFRDLGEAGYTALESFTFDVPTPYTHEAWRGRIRASAKVGASLPPEEVARLDAALAALLAERFPREPLVIPHRVFALMATPPLPA